MDLLGALFTNLSNSWTSFARPRPEGSASGAAHAARRRSRTDVQLLPHAPLIRRCLRQLHGAAHLAEAAVDALTHALAQQFHIAGRVLRVLRGAVAARRRGPDALSLRLQRVVRREEGGAPRVVAPGDQLIERLHLELAAAALA